MPGTSRKDSLPKIAVRNLQRTIRIDPGALQIFAEQALIHSLRIRPRKKSAVRWREIFVLLISDRRMTDLHRRFLHRSGSTDVITFQHGEIFISVPTARRQARLFGGSLRSEIHLYIVHGLLHLFGFDDRTRPEAWRMRVAERRVLDAVAGNTGPRGR